MERGYSEPKVKKQKTDSFHPIFETFLGTNDKRKLDYAMKALEYGFMDLSVGALHVNGSNALDGVSFNKARIITSAYNFDLDAEEETPRGGFVVDIFLHGKEVLEKFLDKDHRQVPKEELKREALKKLLMFLTSKKDHKILIEHKNPSEGKQGIILAQHLFSKLAVKSTFTISSHPGLTVHGEAICLCKENDELVGRIGDTSFGCRKGWHGKADIIMEDEVSITLFPDNFEDDEMSVSSVKSVMSQPFCLADITQIMSQTIVFSFLQRKKCKDRPNNYLIPSIGIGVESFLVCFYDCENDVLLECRPINLYDGDSLSTTAVLFLWLTLNYKLFCSGVTEKMNEFKADFIKCLGEKAKIYLEDVDRPMHISDTTQEDLFLWAPPQILPDVRKLPGQDFIDF